MLYSQRLKSTNIETGMFIHHNSSTSKIKVQLLIVFFFSFVCIFSVFQKGSQQQLSGNIDFSALEHTFDDFKDGICFLLRSKNSKESIKIIQNKSADAAIPTFEKSVGSCFSYQPRWYKPAYYSFLFRYNLF